MTTLKQGQLSTNSALTSLVNSTTGIHNLSEEQSQQLSQEIQTYLVEQQNKEINGKEGVNADEMGDILKNVKTLNLKRFRPFFFKNAHLRVDIDTLSDKIEKFLSQNSDKKAVLMSIAGKHHHWVTVSNVTKGRISFVDSEVSFVNKKNCTTNFIQNENPEDKLYHQLLPMDVYFLEAMA